MNNSTFNNINKKLNLLYIIVIIIMIILHISLSIKKDIAREEAISQLNTVYKEDVETLTNSYYIFIDKRLDNMTAKYKQDFESNNVLNIITKIEEDRLYKYVDCSVSDSCSISYSNIETKVGGQEFRIKIIESNNGEEVYLMYELVNKTFDSYDNDFVEILSYLQSDINTNIPEDILKYLEYVIKTKSHIKRII